MFSIELLWTKIVTLSMHHLQIKKNEYLTKTIDGELIDISKFEMKEMNSTKSIVSKRVRL